MADQIKTPGVYIVENNAFPPAVVGVETAVPAFVGYTERAAFKGKALNNIPFKLTSMTEFETAFGGPAVPRFTLVGPGDSRRQQPVMLDTGEYRVVRVEPSEQQYLLWQAMRMFFDNGGGACWIVSVGSHDDMIALGDEASGLLAGIAALKGEIEPTMLVIPEGVRLSRADSIRLQQAMLAHCGEDMKNRFAILDIHDGDQPLQPDDPVAAFRDALGQNNLDFGAAYYPWLNTTVVQDRDISYRNFLDNAAPAASADQLLQAIVPPGDPAWLRMDVDSLADDGSKLSLEAFLKTAIPAVLSPKQQTMIDQVQLLVETVANFKSLRAEAIRQLNVLPPGSAMAGLYSFVDNSRGVWKAPANVSVNAAISPTVPISSSMQQDLNVTPMGKSVNAIRNFAGRGVLVWGARTLDGNSNDWRYISVRRTMIFLEESCRLAVKPMVFEPNDSRTWVTVKAMIENFLSSVWRQGGLAGAKPEEAYAVKVGAGETMTAEDLRLGVMRIMIMVALGRPAEFLVFTIEQQLPTT